MYEQIAKNKRKSILYIGVFFLLWMGVGALVGLIWAWFSAHHTTGGSDGYGGYTQTVTTNGAIHLGPVIAGVVIAMIFALIGVIFAFVSGSNFVLKASGAQPADPVQYQRLHNLVEALAIGDGIPKPEVYVIDDPSPNAFATGIRPEKAAITFTTGLLTMMNREELEGVASHEMSHIKNYDVRLILIVTVLIGMAGVLASLLWRSAFYSSMTRNQNNNNSQFGVIILAAGTLLAVVAIVVGPIIRMALSRSRESLADVSGVQLTRNPAGLISALKKISGNDKPFAKFNHATAAMCIDDPLQHHETWFHHLFDTHPPIEERIENLERIASGQSI